MMPDIIVENRMGFKGFGVDGIYTCSDIGTTAGVDSGIDEVVNFGVCRAVNEIELWMVRHVFEGRFFLGEIDAHLFPLAHIRDIEEI